MSRGRREVMSASPSSTRPDFGFNSPAITFSRVDFPAPFGTDNADDFTGLDAKIDALQNFIGVAIACNHARDRQLRHQCTPRARRPI